MLAVLEAEQRYATEAEQAVLATWSGWGAIPEVFDAGHENWASERDELRTLLNAKEWNAASKTTLNAHYTDPKIASAMWTALEGAGFKGGKVIEPGSGSGTFIGVAPQGTKMVGIELDPTTAKIASALYPEASIHAYGYEKFTMPEALASASVGNVPFGGFKLHDPRYNPSRMSIHNHFIAKSLRLTAPGGYVAVITSSFTMDSATSNARRELAKQADLVGAVRLPSAAFKDVAGTEVVTDVLVFRKRLESEPVDWTRAAAWLDTSPVEVGDTQLSVNKFFAEHPEAVLGEFEAVSGPFGPMLQVAGDGAVAERLQEALASQLGAAAARGLGYDPQVVATPAGFDPEFLAAGIHDTAPDLSSTMGQVRVSARGKGLEQLSPTGVWENVKIPATGRAQRVAEYASLIDLKVQARAIIDAQKTGEPDLAARDEMRATLTAAYTDYVKTHGPLNRFTLRPGSRPSAKAVEKELVRRERDWRADLDPDLSAAERRSMEVPEEVRAQWVEDINEVEDIQVQEHTVALRADPDFGLLMAVETFDKETGKSAPSQMLRQDVVSTRSVERHASTAAEALAIALDESRELNLARVAELLEVDEDAALEQLGTLVFTDPRTGELRPAVHYLSGDVRSRLLEARAAVEGGKVEFEANVEALEKVLPRQLEHYEIGTKPGGRWIEPSDYEQFCQETFGVSATLTVNPLNQTWEVQGPAVSKYEAGVQHTYGVARKKSPLWVLEQVMNNRNLRITKTITEDRPDGGTSERTVEDTKLTMMARAKGRVLTTAFEKWLYADPVRRERVVGRYNEMFNSYVAPDYKALAEQMSVPGITEGRTPHPYQREAVARIVNEPSVLLDHVVGAGKTGSMVMGAMELRRLGIAQKPWIVVPNHLVEQIAHEFTDWYPAASVLQFPTGADEATRRRFIAASAAGDWDAVVVPYTTFERIGINPLKAAAWIEEETSALRLEAERSKGNKGGEKTTRVTTKRLEAAIQKLETQHEKLLSGKDLGLTFEETGCDYLMVDEAHLMKNLRRNSDFQELAHTGSQRASDLDYKLRSLREMKIDQAIEAGEDVTDYLPAVATFATGTPVANSLAEMWVMQHYLRPDLLEKAGLVTVDAWGNAFTQSTTKVEMDPSGSKYVSKERLSKFVNLPEMLSITNQFASVVTTADITAKLPVLEGGRRKPIVRPASDAILDYVAELAARAENLPPDPSEDNLLKITNDGRAAALDPRLVGLPDDPDGGRVEQVSQEVLRIWESTKDNVYQDAFGDDEPVPGGLQLVFCDRAIPNDEGRFSMYDAVAEKLVDGGMSRDVIAFIHDANTDSEKSHLFEQCRNGKVQVLFGSTDRMGTGTNVQKRAVGLHHVDIPWRPADLEQREGRIIRQGNQNDQVEVMNYITEGTFDVYMWQTLTRKAEFISDVRHAQAGTRTTEDLGGGDMALMAAEMKALATGDTRIIEYTDVLAQLQQLTEVERGHWDSLAGLRSEVAGLRQQVAAGKNVIADLETATVHARTVSEQPVAVFKDGFRTEDRAEMGTRIKHALGEADARARVNFDHSTHKLFDFQGFGVTATWMGKSMSIGFEGVRGLSRSWTSEAWAGPGTGSNLVIRLENIVTSLDKELGDARTRSAGHESRVAQIEAMDLEAPFPEAAQVQALREREMALRAELDMPEPGRSADDISEDDDPMVTVADMPVSEQRKLSRFDVSSFRQGDVVQVGNRSKDQFEVGGKAEDGTWTLTNVEDGSERELRGYTHESLALVARRQEALTDYESLLQQLPETHEKVTSLREVKVGDVVTAQASVKGSNREQCVHGTVVKNKAGGGAGGGDLSIRDGAGQTHVLVFGYINTSVIRHDIVDVDKLHREREAAAAVEMDRRSHVTRQSLMPGDVLLEDIENMGKRGDVARSTSSMFSQRTEVCDPKTGLPRPYERRQVNPRAAKVMQGRELTEEELILLGAPRDLDGTTVERRIGDLRRGDRVLSTDLDPKATIRREVYVVETGYGAMQQIKYRPADEPWAVPEMARRGDDQRVQVLGRRYGALEVSELYQLANPSRVVGTMSSASEETSQIIGQWLRVEGVPAPGPVSEQWREGSRDDMTVAEGRFGGVQKINLGGGATWYAVEVDNSAGTTTLGRFSGSTLIVLDSAEPAMAPSYRGMELPSATNTTANPAATSTVTAAVGQPSPSSATGSPAEPEPVVESVPKPSILTVEHSDTATFLEHVPEEDATLLVTLRQLGFEADTSVGERWTLPEDMGQPTRGARARDVLTQLVDREVPVRRSTHGDMRYLDRALVLNGDFIRLRPGAYVVSEALSASTPIPNALPSLADQEFVARMTLNRAGASLGEVQIGEGRWSLGVRSLEERFVLATAAEAADFSSSHEDDRPLMARLDAVLGVEAHDVQVGDVVSFTAARYAGVSGLTERGRATAPRWTNVTVVAQPLNSVGNAPIWEVQNVEGERHLVLAPTSTTETGRVKVSARRGLGPVPASKLEIPRVENVDLQEVQPGWHVALSGVALGASGRMPQLVDVSGPFVGVKEMPNKPGRYVATVIEHEEPKGVLVFERDLHSPVTVGIPADWKPMEVEEVSERYLAPEVGAAYPGPDVSDTTLWRTLQADLLRPGAVLRYEHSPERFVVLGAEPGQEGKVALTLRDVATAGSQPRSLEVPGTAPFSVEPLPHPVGSELHVIAAQVSEQHNDFQVWWDAESQAQGFQVVMAGPGDPGTTKLSVQDGQGASFSVVLDARQPITLVSVNDDAEPGPMWPEAPDPETLVWMPHESGPDMGM